ncbi:MAG: tRNA (adenosine(37)-N6)-dimethylallyltransferase MiaA [Desulfovibrionales bacterium]|nr:tRNA (adenosine(37)-N6)-dimethylallyltransferase MiaA [Desulfovibrionales bacterium]
MSTVPLLCVVGATGTGKTAAALALAQAVGGAVVNFDSRQVYAGLGIVTAQPTADEQAVCPHFLYGYVPVAQPVRAGAFAEEILQAAQTVWSQGLVPILVGGTGLYLRSLLDGLAPIPEIDPAVRTELLAQCAAQGSPTLYARLRDIDPEYALKIHPNDPQRICRALEVYAATGHTLTYWHQHTARPQGLQACKIGIAAELAALTPRLQTRIQHMLDQGALEEVERAYALCPDRSAPGFSGIGCPELLAVLLDNLPLPEAVLQWQRSTRAYAKRQLTWFRKDTDIAWFDGADHSGMVSVARTFLASYM